MNFNKHLIIVGTARSGTSWLSETIAKQYRYRLLFEPEHEHNTQKGYLVCDQWIQDTTLQKHAVKYLKNVFLNRVDSDWIAQNSNRKLKRHLWPFIPKKYIIKFVRANLAAHFINEYFKIPVIHLIRNPYDVIKSQKRSSFPWLQDLSKFSSQPNLVDCIKFNFGLDITNIENYTIIELRTIRWCIENVIPLEVWEPYVNNSKVIRYETLLADSKEFYDLCIQFNLEPIKDLESHYSLPSSKTHPNSSIRTNKKPATVLDSSEIEQITRILNIFKTKLYPLKN